MGESNPGGGHFGKLSFTKLFPTHKSISHPVENKIIREFSALIGLHFRNIFYPFSGIFTRLPEINMRSIFQIIFERVAQRSATDTHHVRTRLEPSGVSLSACVFIGSTMEKNSQECHELGSNPRLPNTMKLVAELPCSSKILKFQTSAM